MVVLNRAHGGMEKLRATVNMIDLVHGRRAIPLSGTTLQARGEQLRRIGERPAIWWWRWRVRRHDAGRSPCHQQTGFTAHQTDRGGGAQ